MDIFHINKKLKSYFYPIIKIIVCLCLILVFIFRNQFIHVANKTNEIIGFVCMATGIVCIYCIYISCFEISQIHENRTKNKKKTLLSAAKEFSVNQIINLVKKNDIIDIELLINNMNIHIGSSSDCKVYNSKFYDKTYYIDNVDYQTIEDFSNTILKKFGKDKLQVLTIDGDKP